MEPTAVILFLVQLHLLVEAAVVVGILREALAVLAAEEEPHHHLLQLTLVAQGLQVKVLLAEKVETVQATIQQVAVAGRLKSACPLQQIHQTAATAATAFLPLLQALP
jgi:hypothetical protein